jgi:hypothetical protein
MTGPDDTVPDRTADVHATIDRCLEQRDREFVGVWPNFVHEDERTNEGEDLLHAEWLKRCGWSR